MHNSGGQKARYTFSQVKVSIASHIHHGKEAVITAVKCGVRDRLPKNTWCRTQTASVEVLVLGLQHSLEEFTK